MSISRNESDSPKFADPLLEEIHSVFVGYLNTLLTQRDIQTIRGKLKRNIILFGKSVDASAAGQDEYLGLVIHKMAQSNDPIFYMIHNLLIHAPLSNLGLVSCELKVHTLIQNQQFKYYHFGVSLVMLKTDAQWMIEQLHISFPSSGNVDGYLPQIKELEDENAQLKRIIEEKNKQFEDAQHKIGELSTTDGLTGLINHVATDVALYLEVYRSLRYNQKLTIILMAFDHMKDLTAHYGQQATDQMLVSFSEMVASRIRRTDVLGRWTAEQLLLICTNTGLEGAHAIAEDLCKLIAEYPFNDSIRATATFAVCTLGDDDTIATFLLRTEDTFRKAKMKGKNQVIVCE